MNAFGAWEEGVLSERDVVTQAISNAISGTQTKLYIIGSAEILYMDEEHNQRLWEVS